MTIFQIWKLEHTHTLIDKRLHTNPEGRQNHHILVRNWSANASQPYLYKACGNLNNETRFYMNFQLASSFSWLVYLKCKATEHYQEKRQRRLTRMSPLRSKPGSMVMQMLVWLSPCTLLWTPDTGHLLGPRLASTNRPRLNRSPPPTEFHQAPVSDLRGACDGPFRKGLPDCSRWDGPVERMTRGSWCY